jgi:flagellar hook-associated protein 3 FlgL
MRISTANIYQQSVTAILQQQAQLAATQQQVATGKRVISAGDDPVAAVQLQSLTRMQSQQDQYNKNANAAQGRLQLEEQALSDSTTVLQRIRELVLQANNATQTASDRQAIGTELKARVDELQGIANRKDNGGEYLFAGFSAGQQPFTRNGAGAVAYVGDSGQRSVLINSAVAVADGDPGSSVFTNVKQGNGVFTTSASAGNTGGGMIDVGTVQNRSAWVADTYTLRFTTASTWQVTDSGSNVVASGNYGSGSGIVFNGVQVSVSGAPASGDTFTIGAAGRISTFDALDQIATVLGQASDSDAVHAQIHTALGGALQQIDQSLAQVSSVRSTVGTRLSLIDDVAATRDARQADVASSISQLQDLDYASAISKMNQQYVGLQAAQQAYVKIAGLSLFNYL